MSDCFSSSREMAKTRPLIVVWRDMILTEDVNLSPMAGYVGCALAKFADSNGRSCFPSQKKIAAVTRYSLRSVQRAIGELEDAGWITTKMEPIKGGKNQIRGQAWRTTYGFNLPEEDVTQSPSNTEEDVTQSPSRGKSTPDSREEDVRQSPYLEHSTKNINTAHFEEMWKLYPRKIGKKAALRAWVARRREGVEAETLMLAASRYAATCRSEETAKRYIKHASTFFGPDEHWRDYLEEAADPHADSLARSAVEVAAYRARGVSNE